MWPDFIRGLRSMVAPRRLHLETAGAHPEALARVLDRDRPREPRPQAPRGHGGPLSSSQSRDGEPAPIDEPAPVTPEDWRMARRRCLDLLQDRDACAKVVVTADREPRDYDELFEDVARRAASLPVFIAPVTPMGGCEAPTLDHLVEVVEHARELELDIRVLPQVHRAMGIA